MKKILILLLIIMLLVTTAVAGSNTWLSINFDHGIGSSVWQTNQGDMTSDVTPLIINGRTYLPVKWIAESFNLTADYRTASDGTVTKVVFHEVRPFVWPLAGGEDPQEDDMFGAPRDHGEAIIGQHAGIDIDAPEGTEIYASIGGEVKSASWVEGYGWLIVLLHGGNVETYYGHMRYDNPFAVKTGDHVNQGQLIGWVGNTGWSTEPHLHFEIHNIDGIAIDPWPLISPEGAQ